MSNELNDQLKGSIAVTEPIDEEIFNTPEPPVVTSNIRRSPEIGALIAALAKAQGEFGQATKDSANPYYSSKYADLAAVIGAVRPALSKNGIAILQIPCADLRRQVGIVTIGFYHGEQFLEFDLEAPATGKAKDGRDRFDVQTLGACWTYLRRYGLQGATCLASEDDDGNSLMGPENKPMPQRARPNPPQPAPVQAPARGTTNISPEGAISHPENAPRPTTTQQSAQQATQRAATSPAAAQPQAGQLKFIPPDGMTCVVKGVQEVAAPPASEGKRAVRAYLIVTFLGMHNGCNFAYCFDTKFWELLRASVGLECHFQIKERDKDGTHFINIEDVIYVDGVEHVDGKPVQVQE